VGCPSSSVTRRGKNAEDRERVEKERKKQQPRRRLRKGKLNICRKWLHEERINYNI